MPKRASEFSSVVSPSVFCWKGWKEGQLSSNTSHQFSISSVSPKALAGVLHHHEPITPSHLISEEFL